MLQDRSVSTSGKLECSAVNPTAETKNRAQIKRRMPEPRCNVLKKVDQSAKLLQFGEVDVILVEGFVAQIT